MYAAVSLLGVQRTSRAAAYVSSGPPLYIHIAVDLLSMVCVACQFVLGGGLAMNGRDDVSMITWLGVLFIRPLKTGRQGMRIVVCAAFSL